MANPAPSKPNRFNFKAMGSPCQIQLFSKNKVLTAQVARQIIEDVRRLEAKYSRYQATSFLSKINQIAAKAGRIQVDEETAGLLNYALACYQQSEGLFDISSGILRRAWDFNQPCLPEQTAIDRLLEKVGWDKLSWKAPHLAFSVAGMELDFGGIVKEYAVDRAASHCLQAGIQHGVINLGGDVRVIGARVDGTPWQVGIAHPRQQGKLLDTVPLKEGAVASSGDYERCIVVDGVRYGHILNPKTGLPVQHLAAVTVVSDLCVVAGSASTIAMLKEADGINWLEQMGLPYAWVSVAGGQGGTLFNP